MSNEKKPNILQKILKWDSWYNPNTGLGQSGKDKMKGSKIFHVCLDEDTASNLFAADKLANKIILKIPEEGIKNWIAFSGNKKYTDEIIKSLNNLRVKSKFYEAWFTARLYGGALLLMVADDLDAKRWYLPLEAKKVKNIKSLILFNRYEVNIDTKLTSDINSPNFGLPDSYSIITNNQNETLNNIKIHHSRFIRFDGSYLPKRLFELNEYWHDSFLSNLFDDISNYNQVTSAISNLLIDFRMTVYKMKGLSDMLSNEESEKLLQARIELFDKCKSNLKTIVIDQDGEEITQTTPSTLSGIDKLLSKPETSLIAKSGLPHTILFGESPSGLGATGESEKSDFVFEVKAQQEAVLKPRIDYLLGILFKSDIILIPEEELRKISYSFNDIYTLSDKEVSEIRKNMADADEKYYSSGILSAEEIALSRFGSEKYSLDTALNIEKRNAEAELDKEINLESEEEPLTNTEKIIK